MDAIDPQSAVIAAVLVLVVLLVVAAFVRHRQRARGRRLRARYGHEYDLAVKRLGSRARAEAELQERETRVRGLTLLPLSLTEATRLNREWTLLQGRFVDSPQGVLVEADRLVRELMLLRGFPLGDFERLAADLSVDHPRLVEPYRRAHDLAERSRLDGTRPGTEDLRQAVVHYRSMFDELLVVASDDMRPGAEAEADPDAVAGLRHAA